MNTNSASLAPFFQQRFSAVWCGARGDEVALGAREALTPLLHESLPYITLFPAVAFSALFCGVGPAALAIILGVLGVRFDSLRRHIR
jgi:hypothetical protein